MMSCTLCSVCSLFLYPTLLVGGILLFCRFWIRWLAVPCGSATCLVGKTAIVTGSNTGIGYYTGLDLAKRGARVILACRNENKAKEARARIIWETGNTNIVVKVVDFQSLTSVRAFCADIIASEERLDILINNAGAGGLKDVRTKDGLDVLWQTNYFSPFLLTILLINKLKQQPHSRVVNVSSMMAATCNLDLQMVNKYSAATVYSWTKQANILFTRELARRLQGTNVKTYALHPGVIYTDIWRHLPKWVLAWLVPTMKFVFKTSEQGAQTSIYCAVARECEHSTGKLYAECQEIGMYKSCLDMHFAKALWEKTEEFVHLQPNERI